MEIDYAAIGARIRKFRRERGLSQAKLAEMAEVSFGHMCQIELGNTGFSLPLLMRISGALETTPGQLLVPNHAEQKTRRQEILEQLSKELASCSLAEFSMMKKVMFNMKAALKEYDDMQERERGERQGKDGTE